MTPSLVFPFQGNWLDGHKNVPGSVRGPSSHTEEDPSHILIPFQNLSHFPRAHLLPQGWFICMPNISPCLGSQNLFFPMDRGQLQEGWSLVLRLATKSLPHHQRKRYWPPFTTVTIHTAETHVSIPEGRTRQVSNSLLLL